MSHIPQCHKVSCRACNKSQISLTLKTGIKKKCVINDPLGHSLPSSEHCFRLKFVLFC